MRLTTTHTTTRGAWVAAIATLLCLVAMPVAAQQRPLLTQDPESIGTGQVLVEGGFDTGSDVYFPASGLKGNLFRGPILGMAFGLSSIAEIELSGGPYQSLAITSRQTAPLSNQVVIDGDKTSSVVDVVIGTKVRLIAENEGRPAIAFTFATKLPNAKHPSGLGLSTVDFMTGLAAAKTVGATRIVGNLGVAILPDPTSGQRQNEVLTYGASFTRAMTQQADLVAEVNGRANFRGTDAPIGTESRGQVRLGARYTQGGFRVDGAILVGMTERDPRFGVTAGVTYVFKAIATQ